MPRSCCHTGSIGDSTDTELDTCAVGDLLGNEVADGDAGLIKLYRRQDGKFVVKFDYCINLRDVKLSAAQAAGLPVVDLDEYALCLIYHCLGVGAVVCQREVPVAVHGRNGHTEGIILILGADMAGNIAVICREKVGISAVDSFPCAAGGEPAKAGHLALEAVISVKLKGIYIEQGLNLYALDIAVSDLIGDSGHYCRSLGRAGVHTKEPIVLNLLGKCFCTYKFLCI